MGDYFQFSLFILGKHNAKSVRTQFSGGRPSCPTIETATKSTPRRCRGNADQEMVKQVKVERLAGENILPKRSLAILPIKSGKPAKHTTIRFGPNISLMD